MVKRSMYRGSLMPTRSVSLSNDEPPSLVRLLSRCVETVLTTVRAAG